MKITLPDDRRIAATASAAGFADVDAFVRHLLEGAIERGEETELSPAERFGRFERFLDGLGSANPNVDDRREAIYAEREAAVLSDDANPR